MNSEDQCVKLVKLSLKDDKIFESFVKNVSSLCKSNLKNVKNYNKIVGDIWESFCCKYLNDIVGWKTFKLKDCSQEYLKQLHLKTNDVGIDLISIDDNGNNVAIQCKFRKNFQKISWKDVSTFDALVMRTGPFCKNIVMATSYSLRREGKINSNDIFWGKNRFESLKYYDWLKLSNLGDGNIIGGTTTNDINESRLRYFAVNQFR
tara:strand:- start:356 stop:970 length:615 start_codon:yes stop_codon:yes gene_type:complete